MPISFVTAQMTNCIRAPKVVGLPCLRTEALKATSAQEAFFAQPQMGWTSRHVCILLLCPAKDITGAAHVGAGSRGRTSWNEGLLRSLHACVNLSEAALPIVAMSGFALWLGLQMLIAQAVP